MQISAQLLTRSIDYLIAKEDSVTIISRHGIVMKAIELTRNY